jgi:hypothetical protein
MGGVAWELGHVCFGGLASLQFIGIIQGTC